MSRLSGVNWPQILHLSPGAKSWRSLQKLSCLAACTSISIWPALANTQCLIPGGGDSDDDIFIEIQRSAYYRQTLTGIAPGPNPNGSGFPGEAASPFALEVIESGWKGFRWDNATINGTVSLQWGSIGFTQQAINWGGHYSRFGSESELSAAARAGQVLFRYQDQSGSFTANLNAPTWDLRTPMIDNLLAAQSIQPGQPFTLNWFGSSQVRAGQHVILKISQSPPSDPSNLQSVLHTIPCTLPFAIPGVIFMAGNSTSFTIPANTLTRTDVRYHGELQFIRPIGERTGGGNSSWAVSVGDIKTTLFPLAILGGLPPVQAPTIASHPQSHTTIPGSDLVLTVEPSGVEPFHYQWFKDGVALEHETGARLSLLNAKESDSGEYTVSVRNAGGTTQSDPAVIRISRPADPVVVGADLRISRAAGTGLPRIHVKALGTGVLLLEYSLDFRAWHPWRNQSVEQDQEINLAADELGTADTLFFRESTSSTPSVNP